MTIEHKKNYLKQYRRSVAKIDALAVSLDNLRFDAIPGGIDYSKDKIMTSPTNDQFVNHCIKVEEVLEKIHKAKAESIEQCNKILDAIKTVDNEIYQSILMRRYIALQSWEVIAYEMNYSIQHIYELHGEALADIRIPEVDYEIIRVNQSKSE